MTHVAVRGRAALAMLAATFLEFGAEHGCEVCGCTETRACPGGCAWSAQFLMAGRYVCTTSRCFRKAMGLTAAGAIARTAASVQESNHGEQPPPLEADAPGAARARRRRAARGR
jgi:hypothetical protein